MASKENTKLHTVTATTAVDPVVPLPTGTAVPRLGDGLQLGSWIENAPGFAIPELINSTDASSSCEVVQAEIIEVGNSEYTDNGGYVRLHFKVQQANGNIVKRHADFHNVWLRHQCRCSEVADGQNVGCVHHKTGERLIDPSSREISTAAPASIRYTPASSNIGATMTITWAPLDKGSKPHVSTFDGDQIRELLHDAYSVDNRTFSGLSNDVSRIEVHFGDYIRRSPRISSDVYIKDVLATLKAHGACVVRGRGLDTEEIIQELIGKDRDVWHSHFGRIEDIRPDNTSNKNNDQLTYTSDPVRLHTDQPFVELPPGLQMLQCIRPADHGGANTLVDVQAVAEYLRNTDYLAFKLLTSTPVHFKRTQKEFSSSHMAPLLQVDENDKLLQVRFSYFSMAPFRLPFSIMSAWYNAYNKFTRLVENPNNHYKVDLGPGDFVIYNNFKALHARDGFSGLRHMRGVYFNTQDVEDFHSVVLDTVRIPMANAY